MNVRWGAVDRDGSAGSSVRFEQAIAAGRLSWQGTMTMSLVRLPLVALSIWVALVSLGAMGRVQPAPDGSARQVVSLAFPFVVDGGTLLLLAWYLRREHLRFRDLLGMQRSRLARDVGLGLGLFVVLLFLSQAFRLVGLFVAFGPGFITVFQQVMESFASTRPSFLFVLWTLLVLPATTSITEEITYRAYALPRLEALSQRASVALLINALGFGLQHVLLPLVSVQVSLARLVETFLLGLAFGAAYLRLRRVLPLIIAHWGLNFVVGLLPVLAGGG